MILACRFDFNTGFWPRHRHGYGRRACVDSCNKILTLRPAQKSIHCSDDEVLGCPLQGTGELLNSRGIVMVCCQPPKKIAWPRRLRVVERCLLGGVEERSPTGEDTGSQDTVVGSRADPTNGHQAGATTVTRFWSLVTMHGSSFMRFSRDQIALAQISLNGRVSLQVSGDEVAR